jgi:hypothetical protein
MVKVPANGRRINLIGVKRRGGNTERLGQERLASNTLANTIGSVFGTVSGDEAVE